MKSYAAWCRKQGASAQCSPGAIVLGLLAVVAIVCYVYRQVILDTLIMIGIGVGILCGCALAIAITINALKWRRVHAAELTARYELAAQEADYQNEPEDEHDPVLDAEIRYAHLDEPTWSEVIRDPADKPVPAGQALDELDRDLLDLTGK
jgi:hypothetical protein